MLSPVTLAHWIIGDGTAHSGLFICTDSFFLKEVVLLMNILNICYCLESSIKYHRENAPRIYIKARSIPTLRNVALWATLFFHICTRLCIIN